MPNDTLLVQTRELSWLEICQKAWGKEWTKPDIVYEWSNGRKFESTDGKGGGPYSEEHE